MIVVRLTQRGLPRIPNSQVGQTFPVVRRTGVANRCYLVIDYRCPRPGATQPSYTHQRWTLAPDDCEVVDDDDIATEPDLRTCLQQPLMDALNTEETGAALVEVARAAHRAEQELAARTPRWKP